MLISVSIVVKKELFFKYFSAKLFIKSFNQLEMKLKIKLLTATKSQLDDYVSNSFFPSKLFRACFRGKTNFKQNSEGK